jgi:DNA-3-methyladenine glycosylase
MQLSKIPRSFYMRPTLEVARRLLGLFLVRTVGSTRMVGRIVEVEGYLGSSDPASHAYRGMTNRNAVMFRPGGHLYVYFTYGMHFCCNVVTGPSGNAGAVLLRAVEPVEGVDLMRRNRDLPEGRLEMICNGPAKLCAAFGIAREMNGTDLCGERIWIGRQVKRPRFEIEQTPRIGITNGRHHPWRFVIADSPFLSRTKPHRGEIRRARRRD